MFYVLTLLIGIGAGAMSVFAIIEFRRRQLKELQGKLDTQSRVNEDRLALIREKERRIDEFEQRVVTFDELLGENTILKRDLQNVDVTMRKLEMDRDTQRETQQQLDQRGSELARQYLKDNVKWIGSSLTANNFSTCKDRMQKVIESCRRIGFEIRSSEEDALLTDLKANYEKVVRATLQREEQARIRARIREEQKLEREIEKELNQLERERTAITAALEKALAEAEDEHSAEVEQLRARLAEAEEKSQRAISRAQETRSGYVYVISNIGSFGDDVFKIGMTRRLEPLDRVRELGDASVPFPFDVHMMISCEDAPTLETALHQDLHTQRLNKVNPRKEFFRTSIDRIRQIVEAHHGEVEYVADPEALQYRESLTISGDDLEYVESVFEELETEEDTALNDE